MKCPNCGGFMVGITYPNGYEEFECEECGCVVQDAHMNELYNEKCRYR